MQEASFEQVLQWRDLSADEVYHIAHLENEARDTMSAKLGSIAFSGNPHKLLAEANLILSNYEVWSHTWLENQALMRGMTTYRKIDFEPSDFGMWLEAQFTAHPELRAKDIAGIAGISRGYLSGLRSGIKRNPSENVISRVRQAFTID